jgi:hypothetical protein
LLAGSATAICLEGADFTGSTLKGVDFNNAMYDSRTIFPKGFTPPANMEWTGRRRTCR